MMGQKLTIPTQYGEVYISLEQGQVSDDLDRKTIWYTSNEDYLLQQGIYDEIVYEVMSGLGIPDEVYTLHRTDFGAEAVWTQEGYSYRLQIDSEDTIFERTPVSFTTYFAPDGPSHSYAYWSALSATIDVEGTTATVHYHWHGASPASAGGPPEPEVVDLLDRDAVFDLYQRLWQKGTQAPEAKAVFGYIQQLCGFDSCPRAEENKINHSFAWLTAYRAKNEIRHCCWYCGHEVGWPADEEADV